MKTSAKVLLIAVATVAFWGVAAPFIAKIPASEPHPSNVKIYQITADHPQFGSLDLDGWLDVSAWGSSTKAAVLAQLRDPDSAKFSEIFAVGDRKVGKAFPVIICGKVNAKNGFGGFTGDQPFVRFMATGAVTLEKQTAIKEWNAYCAGGHKDPA